MDSDSDKENRDPQQYGQPAKKPKPNKAGNNTGVVATTSTALPDAEANEDYVLFAAKVDRVIRKSCGDEIADLHPYLFHPELEKHKDYNRHFTVPARGAPNRVWTFLVPGYNTSEVWNPQWTAALTPGYMANRKAVAHAFIRDHGYWTTLALRKRANIVRLHERGPISASNRITKPAIPRVLPPIFRVCPITMNWYPTDQYFPGRDPFLVGMDMYYEPNIINQIFHFGPITNPNLEKETESERLRLQATMLAYRAYNNPYQQSAQAEDTGIIYSWTRNPQDGQDMVSMGPRGPWVMIPAATDPEPLRKNRAIARYNEQQARLGLPAYLSNADDRQQ